MHRCKVALSVLTLLIVLWGALSLAIAGTLTVTAQRARVRSGPGPTHSPLTTVLRGGTFAILETQQQWHRIRLEDGREGWIAASVVQVQPAERGVTVVAQADAQAATGVQRKALVIGNAAYQVGRLRNPVHDATAIAATLRQTHFDVMLRTDVNRQEMIEAVRTFAQTIPHGGVALFYFAGHGLQVNGENFLVPVDADIQRESDVEFVAVPAGRVLAALEDASGSVNIVILDACRNNPFARGWRSLSRGLAQMQAAAGTLIAYATSPGNVASDGEGENGVYTKYLLQSLRTPGLKVEEVFKRARIGVMQETGEQQIPWESSSLTGDFYFVSPAAGKTPTVAALPPPSPPSPPPSTPARGLAGRWEGRYQCQSEKIGFSLDITNHNANRLAATFEFFPLPGTLSFPRGSFRMSGDYNRADGSFRLHSTGWIKRPLGLQSHDIEGQLAPNGSTIHGRILTTGCANFVLTRK